MSFFGLALYFCLLSQQTQPNFDWATTDTLLKITPDPIVAVTLVPNGDGWLIVAGGKHWSSVGNTSCRSIPVSRTTILYREGSPNLTLTLSCPEVNP